ncbi:MAG: NosD domain-containing protein [bacterium]|nr:NosD domain-containing protein [bacterium]
MINRKWVLFYIFVYFICSGHSFWPYQKQKENSSPQKSSSGPDEFPKETIIISEDTTWSGKLEIRQVVLIKKGVSLTIAPGTELIFSGAKIKTEDVHTIQGGGIKVEGKIIAAGTKDKPIIFTGKEKYRGWWGNIYLTYSQDNIFTYCIFEYANYAIHSHFSSLTVSHSLFENNYEGCRLGYSQALIENCVFRLNESRGINFRAGKNNIRNNSIVGNRVGIFIYEKGNQSDIVLNNIFNNAEYNLQLGDFHREDVKVSKNFWGKKADHDKMIHDNKDDNNLGKVEYLPVIEEEIHWKDDTIVKNLR